MSDRRELLRFLTAGSVDDGKSTLIGRLLHDSNTIYQDQIAAIRSVSERGSGSGAVDFSLVTDGLRIEREQGITIDVAYRYFATPRRKFIVADSPGHEQYTRNMATGASSASLAVLLMDARKGVLPQTYRHAGIAWLMGIRSFAIVVNKMDLVHFDEEIFLRIEADFKRFIEQLGQAMLQFIPCCAPEGENVVRRSKRMPWYTGPTLLEHLETVPIQARHNLDQLRFPVQSVIRPAETGERYYAGQVASGVVQVGDTILAMHSGCTARVAGIQLGHRKVDCAYPPLSVTLQLDREVDIGRGDMLADPGCPPLATRRFAATLLWMSTAPLIPGQPYLIKHSTRYVCASIIRLTGVIDPVTLERRPAGTLKLNEFAEVEIETHQPLYADPYVENRATGAFIVVEPISNETAAAGMFASGLQDRANPLPDRHASQGLTLWFTGLSSSGKSAISQAVYEKLWAKGHKVELLDGDVVRQHLSKDLGFSKEGRDENIRRMGFMAELLTRNGVIVLVAAISPYREVRREIRARIGNFLEVYVNAPLAVVEQRDVQGLYRRCRAGEIHDVSGMDDPYEPPLAAEVECCTDRETLAESVEKVIRAVEDRLAGRARVEAGYPCYS